MMGKDKWALRRKMGRRGMWSFLWQCLGVVLKVLISDDESQSSLVALGQGGEEGI